MPRQKYVKGKPCKPYNSTLGEFFRVRDVLGMSLPIIDTDSATGKSKTATRPSKHQLLPLQAVRTALLATASL
jgi:hypothetical protein